MGAMILQIDRRALQQALRLPADITVAAVWYDPSTDALNLRVEAPSLPPVFPYSQLVRRIAEYRDRPAKTGEIISEFVEFR